MIFNNYSSTNLHEYRGCLLVKNSFINISEVNRQYLNSFGTRSEDNFEKVSIFTGQHSQFLRCLEKSLPPRPGGFPLNGRFPWPGYPNPSLLKLTACRVLLQKSEEKAQSWDFCQQRRFQRSIAKLELSRILLLDKSLSDLFFILGLTEAYWPFKSCA